jgi:hypothetical protein
MAKASDNVFPKLIVAEGATPSSPAAGQQKLFVDSVDHKLKRVDSAGAVTTVEGGTSSGGGTSGPLAYTAYTSASAYTTSSTTAVQIDATNLKVTFVAPSSGRVMVDLSALAQGPAAPNYGEWSLFESGAIISSTISQFLNSGGSIIIPAMTRMVLTGLTPGSSHTYTWGWRVSAGSATIYSTVHKAVMAVWALP